MTNTFTPSSTQKQPPFDRNAELIQKLVEALDYLLEQTVDQDLKYGIGLSEGEQDARDKALAVIAEATARAA